MRNSKILQQVFIVIGLNGLISFMTYAKEISLKYEHLSYFQAKNETCITNNHNSDNFDILIVINEQNNMV